MKEKFKSFNFSDASLERLAQVNQILAEYAAQGYRLSLRQLYYQLVARGKLPNTLQHYKRLSELITDARMAGLVDWDAIEDRNRETITPPMWRDPAEIVQAAAAQFAIDRWEDQANHVEVMVEKAALEGVLIPVCREQGIRFTSNRGYSSSSAMYEAAKRLDQMVRRGKIVHILYFGDHDPSGLDMDRDVVERLCLLSRREVQVRRLALNYDQVQVLNPPENPAKTTDSRAAAYIERFGESSWELDAVAPEQLVRLVEGAVEELRDRKRWQAALVRESDMKRDLQRFADDWEAQHDG